MRVQETRFIIFSMFMLAACEPTGPYSIVGSASLPTCEEAGTFDLAGAWFDTGSVTVETEGCDGAAPGSVFDSCALDWEFEHVLDDGGSPIDDDYTILVDREYVIKARLCGATLWFEGGWWLPVEDEGECTYEEDSAEEVGIQMEGSSLLVSDPDFEPFLVAVGTLALEGRCAGSYAIRLVQRDQVVTSRSPK